MSTIDAPESELTTIQSTRVEDLLAEFPAGFCFPIEPIERQNRVMAMIGTFLAEEMVTGAEASEKLERLLTGLKAQICKSWIPAARDKLALMVKADQFIKEHDEAEVARAVETTAKAQVRAESKLNDAASAHDRAVAEHKQAKATAEELRGAQTVMATGDIPITSAWATLQQLTGQ